MRPGPGSTEEMRSPLELWRRWTAALLTGLETDLGEQTRLEVMERCGRTCARFHRDVEQAEAAARGAEGLDDLLERLNQLEGFWCGTWSAEDGVIRALCETCGCPLVRAGLVDPSPALCICSRGWVREVFEACLDRPVEVELPRAIGRGDRVCEFLVRCTRSRGGSDRDAPLPRGETT